MLRFFFYFFFGRFPFTVTLQSRPPTPPPLPLSPSLYFHVSRLCFARGRDPRVRSHVILTSTHEHLALLISSRSPSSPFTASSCGRDREREQGFVMSHPGRWCEERHVARTSTPRGRCRCTDTGACGPGSRSCSRCRRSGRRRACPGRCSGLLERCTKGKGHF